MVNDMNNITITLPRKVRTIIETLVSAGFEAYAVGGCVRDSILGRAPKDWDITTNAEPWQVKRLFRSTIDTGIEHGTVTVMLDHEGFEVTTYRIDGKYEDNRHPSEVSFTRELSEDLLRRDFTINAMAYNESAGLVDLFGGIEDLKNGVIRAVGNPAERFNEDALRIMRAARFASELGFEIEEETEKAMADYAENIRDVSAERIRVELQKLIMGKAPEKLYILLKCGVTKIVFPEWDECVATEQESKYHIANVGEHTMICLRVLHELLGIGASKEKNGQSGEPEKITTDIKEHEGKAVGENIASNYIFADGRTLSDFAVHDFSEDFTEKEKTILCLAVLLHDIGKPQAKTMDGDVAHFYGHPEQSADIAVKILHRLKYDNDTVHMVKTLVAHHDDRIRYNWDKGSRSAAKLMNKIGEKASRMLIPLMYADVFGHSPDYFDESLEVMAKLEARLEEFISSKEAASLKDLKINGRDLIDMGLAPGRELGIVLDELLTEVLEEPQLNEREVLLERAESFAAFGTKNKYKKLFFDLDGTLTNSEEGIVRCHEYALRTLGVPEEKFGDLRRFIGPPLVICYNEFFEEEEKRQEAVRLYRKRYNEVGWKENYVYPGIHEMLERLKNAGFKMYIATSKPEHFAKRIAEYFDFAKYFDGICGASKDDKRSKKADVLQYALDMAGVELVRSNPEFDEASKTGDTGQPAFKLARPYEALMIGDRFYDVEGAAAFGMRTMGVTFGFGSDKELLGAGAVMLAGSALEVAEKLSGE